MILERFEAKGLAHYSYAIGCPAAGKMAVIDPRRDIDVYLEFAAARGLEISHVLETHIHADFASGARELASRTGARLCLSGHDRGETFEVSFQHEDLADGDTITIGSLKLEALHTPGHTPEHLSFLVYDLNRSSRVPQMFFSGDFLFTGSVGRPDLLGEEEREGLARRLFESVGKLDGLPDALEVYPAHGAGSLCGSQIGGRAQSTLGYERVVNPYLDSSLDQKAFLAMVFENLPPQPGYYRRMKELNARGPDILNGLPQVPALSASRFQSVRREGALVVDLRDQSFFGGGHIPEAINIGWGDSFALWAPWMLPPDRTLLLVGSGEEEMEEVTRSLIRVGLDAIGGRLQGGFPSWRESGRPIEMIEQVSVHRLQERLGSQDLHLLDVRTDEEWQQGHVAGAEHVRLDELPDKMEDLPRRKWTVMCGSGYRSSLAASLLRRAGFEGIANLAGGMQAWKAAGLALGA